MADLRRFFVDEPLKNKESIIVCGEQFNHMVNVLRMKNDDTVVLLDGLGFEYQATLTKINKNDCQLNIISNAKCLAEPSINVTLFFAVTKGEKMELVCQKAVELGVNKIVPFESKFTVAKDNQNKTIRLNKIAVEAVKQCKRGVLVNVENTFSFKQLLQEISRNDFDLALVCYESENDNHIKNVLCQNMQAKNIAIIVGSEGGFDASEIESLVQCGVKSVSLGKRILRAETASIAATSIVMYQFDNMQ